MNRYAEAFEAVAMALEKIKPNYAGLAAWQSKKFGVWLVTVMTLLAVGYLRYGDGQEDALLDCVQYIVWVSIAYIVAQSLVDAVDKLAAGLSTGMVSLRADSAVEEKQEENQ